MTGGQPVHRRFPAFSAERVLKVVTRAILSVANVARPFLGQDCCWEHAFAPAAPEVVRAGIGVGE